MIKGHWVNYEPIPLNVIIFSPASAVVPSSVTDNLRRNEDCLGPTISRECCKLKPT